MVAIPQPSNGTPQAVHALYARRVAAQTPRNYLGWSEIGTECDRALWYGFRWAGRGAIEGRMGRLFDTGHREEARLLQDLRDCGMDVWDRDERGEQFGVSSIGGHFRGHADAVVRGLPEAPLTPHLVDVKTVKSKKFDELLKKGLRALYPKYWAQGQGYMGKLELERAAFIFVCKDDDRIHVERFAFDRAEFDKYEARAARIIRAATPPARISEDPAWFACKFCDFHDVCHGAKLAAVNCRTCAHSTPVEIGEAAAWQCDAGHSQIQQPAAAHSCHRFIPVLLERLGAPVDSDGDAVTYQRADGSRFNNGPAPGFSSAEIALAPDAVTDPTVQMLKSQFLTARVIA
jgi:hypothetical protein